MARIELNNIAHSYLAQPKRAEDYALRKLNHTWEQGKAYALLGPSGCGKTTLLNVVSGLLAPSEGKILFDSQDVTDQQPQQRNIAQVFQFPVIYDTMTVYDNLAFPLRNRGVAVNEIKNRVSEVAEMLELDSVLHRRASNLTADEKQKISMGRGLVRNDVSAILFDEPLTVIDPQLKWQLRRKLKQVHERFHHTMVYVTHDQLEAMTFADEVVVMIDGEVVQIGAPNELFENPRHTFVGYFIGSPGMNFMPCTIADGAAVVAGTRIAVHPQVAEQATKATGPLELGIRPEYLQLVDEASGIPVKIDALDHLGNYKILTARMAEHTLKVKFSEAQVLRGEEVYLHFPIEYTKIYADSQLLEPQS